MFGCFIILRYLADIDVCLVLLCCVLPMLWLFVCLGCLSVCVFCLFVSCLSVACYLVLVWFCCVVYCLLCWVFLYLVLIVLYFFFLM